MYLPAAIRRLRTSPAKPGSSDKGGISENISILTPDPPDTTTYRKWFFNEKVRLARNLKTEPFKVLFGLI